jgi:hypothetical protein
MLFPLHPRARKMAAEFGFEFDVIRAIEPLGVFWSLCNWKPVPVPGL